MSVITYINVVKIWDLFMLCEAVSYNQMADVVVLSEGLDCVVKGCDSEIGARS